MILYHATPRRNLDSIRKHGLQPQRATGRIKGIWLHTQSKTPWAILHTIKRHRLNSFDDVVILKCKIPRNRLTRRWRGLWTCDSVITDFDVVDAATAAASPITESETEKDAGK